MFLFLLFKIIKLPFRNYYGVFVMSTQNNEKNWELSENPLKERIVQLMTEKELKHPYAFATRVGLSRGTFTGIWVEGRRSLHRKTIEKICAATGANPSWLEHGQGPAFLDIPHRTELGREKTTEIAQSSAQPVKITLDVPRLEQAIQTAEDALNVTNAYMQAEHKAIFIATLYQSQHDTLLQACIQLVEDALKETRRDMSPNTKSQLITIIYSFYSDQPWTQQQLKSALDQLIRSVH